MRDDEETHFTTEKKIENPDTQRTFNLNNAPKPTDSNSNVQKPTQLTVATYGLSMWACVCVCIVFAVRNVYKYVDTESTTMRARSNVFFVCNSFIRSFIFSIERRLPHSALFIRLLLLSFSASTQSCVSVCSLQLFFSHMSTFSIMCITALACIANHIIHFTNDERREK